MPEDEGEEDGAQGEDDLDGGADLADMQVNPEEEEDIAELVEEEMPVASNLKEEDWEMIETGIDPDEWLREC